MEQITLALSDILSNKPSCYLNYSRHNSRLDLGICALRLSSGQRIIQSIAIHRDPNPRALEIETETP